MSSLLNPETGWVQAKQISVISRAEVEKRIGPTADHLSLLAGGQANSNIRVGEDRVLRLSRREAVVVAKEVALWKRPWKNLIVPEVLASGEDFILSRYVPHGLVEENAVTGMALGKALAEIHSNTYPKSGFLSGDLSLEEPMDDFVDDMWSYLCSFEEKPKAVLPEEFLDEVLGFFDERIDDLKGAVGKPVLLHGDFKAANLHWTDRGLPLVLDWEFAYVGSALMDLGQLFRWGASPEFTDAFTKAYVEGGGTLPTAWSRWAETLDLINLTGWLSTCTIGTPKALAIAGRIRKTMTVKEQA